jgi:hypothetical protein
MKLGSWLLLAVFLTQSFISCDKDSTKANNKVHGLQTLPGAWELRSWYGGNGPAGGGSLAPGNGDIKRFTDSLYWFASNGRVWDSGSYKLTTGINPDTRKEMDALLVKGDTSFPTFFHIADDTLTIYNGSVAWDGTVLKYVRIATPGDLMELGD